MNMTTWYYNNIGSKLTKGYFIEIGVMNGKTQNSTNILENNGWEGLLVEPVPSNIKSIKKNRKTPLIEGAVWKTDGVVEIVDVGVRGHTGIKETHRNPKAAKNILKVKSYKFSSLPIPKHIDYLQIDTEGSELEILKTINFNDYNIDYICIEDDGGCTKNDPTYHDFMESIGYTRIRIQEQDRLYKRSIL